MCISRYKGYTTQNLLVSSGGLFRDPLHRLDQSRQPHVGAGVRRRSAPRPRVTVRSWCLHAGNLETDDEV